MLDCKAAVLLYVGRHNPFRGDYTIRIDRTKELPFMVEQNIIDRASGFNEAFHQLKVDFFRFWQSDIFLTWHWWLEAVLAVLPWAVWAAVRKKESSMRLFCAGFIVLIISSYLDMLGMSMGLWGYHSAVIPTIPPYAPWNFSLLPVAAMLFYQINPSLNKFVKAGIFAGFSAFVCEPFFTWLKMYDPQNWEHYYSFPIFVVIYLIGHCFAYGKRYEPV